MAAVDTLKSDEATAQEEEERKGIISRVMNLDVKVDKGGTRATVVLPGLSYDDFDRTGNIGMWRIAKHFEFARYATNHSSCFAGYKLLEKNTFFIVAGVYDISQELYRYIRQERYAINCGMQTESLTYGNSSTVTKSTWYRIDDGKSLATLTFKYVMVDRKTRRPTPLPQWYKEQVKRTKNPDSYQWLKPLKVPPEAFQYEKVVEYSDTDINQHANNSFFVRACFDAAATACYAKSYKHLKGDFFRYLTRRMWVLYTKESNVGSRVTVFTWSDPDQIDKVYFQIKKDDVSLFHAALQVYMDNVLQSKL